MLVNDDVQLSMSTMSDSVRSRNERPNSLSSHESTLSSQSDISIRSARAARVFGDLVSQVENETSLCYSPSPFRKKKQGLKNITNVVCSNSPKRVLPFGSIQFTTAKKFAKNNEIDQKGRGEEEKQNVTNKRAVNQKEELLQGNSVTKPLQSKTAASKRNTKEKNVNKIPKRRKHAQSKHRSSSTHQAQASKAEQAIKLATESVNKTLNASKAAKMDHFRFVAAEVARLKQEWKEEKEQAEKFYAEMEKTKRERLDVVNQINSQYAKNKVESERAMWQSRLNELEKEIKFKSAVYVEHKKRLKDNEDKRRRMSVAVKTKHRNIRRENVAVMRLESIQEQHESHELRMASHRDVEAYKKQCEQERRDSLAFRGRECVRQRMEEAERQASQKIAESESLEFKWAGERDAEAYKKQCEQERRDSLAFRGRECVRQRHEEEERKEQEKIKDHESHELRMASHRDAEAYKKQCEQERRDSLAFRGRECVRQRMEEAERQASQKIAESESLELKWAGERDAEAYKKQCEQERRDSLAFRGRECVRQRHEEEERKEQEKIKDHESHELRMASHRDVEAYKKQCEQERRDSLEFRGRECVLRRAVMEELKALAKEQEHEYYVLKWAAQDDVKAYLAEVAKERRESLAFRNAEGRRHRELEEQWRCEEIQKEHELEEMRSACQKDVEEYRKKCAERDRASFCFRGKELQTQKLILEERRQKEYEEEQQRRELDTLARADVEEYIKDCKKRRRMSLAVRAKEHRCHLKWKKIMAEAEREEKSRHSKNASLDRKYVELAKEKERARNALDALQKAQKIFSTSNPFGSLLE